MPMRRTLDVYRVPCESKSGTQKLTVFVSNRMRLYHDGSVALDLPDHDARPDCDSGAVIDDVY